MLYGTKSDKSKAVTYDKEELDEKFENVTPDLPDIDTTPTSGSTNLVTSGGVKAADEALYNKLRPIVTTLKPSGGVVVGDRETNLIDNIQVNPNDEYILRFSGWATFSDGGASGVQNEGIRFGIGIGGQPTHIEGPKNWAMPATSVGGYGYFEFTQFGTLGQSSIRLYALNESSEDIYINNMEVQLINIKRYN